MTAMLRPATAADRRDLIALALAEDAAWSGVPEVSAEEAGELIDSSKEAWMKNILRIYI